MSDHDERGRSDLERRLDAAFSQTRPRRGFEDELWARLQARRPWWRRLGGELGGALAHAPWGGVATGLAALVVVGLVVTLVRLSGPHGGGASTSSAPAAQAPVAGPAASGASRADTGAAAALPFGRLPAPTAAGVIQAVRPAGASALPAGAQGASVQGAGPPQPPPGLAVYLYDPASGPADGTVLETNALPAVQSVGIYQSRPPAEAVAAAEAGRASSGAVVLTQARLVYVAVVSGRQGFLEPAYLFTGSAGTVPVQVLVSALAPASLR